MDQKTIVPRGHGKKLSVMGAQLTLLCEAQRTGKAWSLMEVTLPRDSGPPLHEHPWDEGYYVLDGEVRFTLAEEQLIAKPGDFLYAPGGTLHAFQGASDTAARVLVFDAPAAAEAFFRDVEREVTDLPRDMSKVPDIGHRHGLHFARG